MFFIDKLNYFLITRAKSVVAYLRKFTEPRYVIAFVVIYPHIYTNILNVISAAQALMVNIADQFYSWIESAFWGVFNFIKSKLQGIWFGDQIAYVLAGITMALPFLVYIIFKHAFIPIANTLLIISLNVLGAVFYIFCRVVIPALKQAFGAYLFAKFMPASYKYVAKALDRLARGKFGGFVGALLGSVAPFGMFFVGPIIISSVTDSACASAYSPPIIGTPYLIPYTQPVMYQYTLAPIMSWIFSTIYGQPIVDQVYVMSFINSGASWDVQRLTALSYIMAGTYFGAYYGPYYPGAYLSLIPAFSSIYPYFEYLVTSGYLPYSISYISADLHYEIVHATFSYIFTEAPIYTLMIHDASFLTVPEYVYAYLQDYSYLWLPPEVNVVVQDFSNLVYMA